MISAYFVISSGPTFRHPRKFLFFFFFNVAFFLFVCIFRISIIALNIFFSAFLRFFIFGGQSVRAHVRAFSYMIPVLSYRERKASFGEEQLDSAISLTFASKNYIISTLNCRLSIHRRSPWRRRELLIEICMSAIEKDWERRVRIFAETTAKPGYSRLQGNKKCCLLMKKSIITGIEQ